MIFFCIVFQTLFLETADTYFNYRMFELKSLTLRGLVLKVTFFQTKQEVRNMNDVTLYDSTTFNAAEI